MTHYAFYSLQLGFNVQEHLGDKLVAVIMLNQ